MDSINGLNQIAQIIRQRLSADRSSPSVTKEMDLSATSSAAAGGAKVSADEIKRKIGGRIKALSGEERRGKKAAQIFVEVVLMWEFGDQMLNDPQFAELSNDVVESMVENPVVWKKLQTLLSQLSGP